MPEGPSATAPGSPVLPVLRVWPLGVWTLLLQQLLPQEELPSKIDVRVQLPPAGVTGVRAGEGGMPLLLLLLLLPQLSSELLGLLLLLLAAGGSRVLASCSSIGSHGMHLHCHIRSCAVPFPQCKHMPAPFATSASQTLTKYSVEAAWPVRATATLHDVGTLLCSARQAMHALPAPT